MCENQCQFFVMVDFREEAFTWLINIAPEFDNMGLMTILFPPISVLEQKFCFRLKILSSQKCCGFLFFFYSSCYMNSISVEALTFFSKDLNNGKERTRSEC